MFLRPIGGHRLCNDGVRIASFDRLVVTGPDEARRPVIASRKWKHMVYTGFRPQVLMDSDCSERVQLVDRLERFLDDYHFRVKELSLVHGFNDC